ncbi:hypothetical protein [Metasolibacillus meyeri]|uniref:hypothetical protein n=1 Tax=Metasolibacillus meyeri TaxID=1071052 RepID=UPI000D325A8E|nr:hypothetical protein [Metasolibacillus meyeri]
MSTLLKNNSKNIVLIVLVIFIATSLFIFLNKKEASSPQTEVMMVEELPNGEREVVTPLQNDNTQFIAKEEQLKSFIARQTKLDNTSIAVYLTPVAGEEGKEPQFVSCSVVLDTTNKLSIR